MYSGLVDGCLFEANGAWQPFGVVKLLIVKLQSDVKAVRKFSLQGQKNSCGLSLQAWISCQAEIIDHQRNSDDKMKGNMG